MNSWWLRLSGYAVPQVRSWLLVLILLLVGSGLALLAPWPLEVIVDFVLPERPLPAAVAWLAALPGGATASGRLAWLAWLTVLLFLLRRVAGIFQEYVQAGATSRMLYHLAGDLFLELQRRSLLFHARQHTGDLVRRVTADTACVSRLMTHVHLPLLKSVVNLSLMFVVMWQLSRAAALFAIGLTVPLGVLVRIFARPMSERQFQQWERQGEIASFAEQTLTALPIVQAFGREELEDRRFRQLAGRTLQATLRSELAQHQFNASGGAVSACATALVMTVGGLSVLRDRLSVGDLLVLISYFAALYSPIETLAYLSEGFAAAQAGARRVFGILETGDPRIADGPEATAFPEPSAGVEVRLNDVTFGYEPEHPVLRRASLGIRPGEIVALVGPTGAGKSTLAGLLLRFFDPQEGSISFNGLDVRNLQLASLRSRIALVPQEPFLAPLTIADNIACGRPSASREEIMAAAVASGADAFIRKLPGGYDTVIGERGVTLSGGEKQRLSIARALVRDAPVLILDEPTSALDAATEATLIDAIRRLKRGRTTLIIAHRFSTVRCADRIVVLQHGTVVEQGTHEQLIANRALYAGLYESQFTVAKAPLSPGSV